MSAPDDFLAPQCEPGRLHDYQLRRNIRDALASQLPKFQGTLLDVGCGRMPYKALLTSPPSAVTRYIGLDLPGNPHGSPDLLFDGRGIPLEEASVDCVTATEVLEHCPEPIDTLREISRVLRPGGVFFFTVPFFWPLHEVPSDFHRFTPFALAKLLAEAGLTAGEIRAHGGWDGSLAQMIGLWAHYRGMRPWKRRVLSWAAWPVVALLNVMDQTPGDARHESSMTTGYSGIAIKPQEDAA